MTFWYAGQCSNHLSHLARATTPSARGYPVIPAPFDEKTVYPWTGHFVKDQLTKYQGLCMVSFPFHGFLYVP